MTEVRSYKSLDNQLWDSLEEAQQADRMIILKAGLKDVISNFYRTGVDQEDILMGMLEFRHELAMLFWAYDRRA